MTMRINRGAILRSVEQPHIKTNLPDFQPGDTVKVETKVVEGTRTRNQAFEGVVIAINGSGSRKSFTVRKISFGEGVERVFPFSSPLVANVTVLERGKVRRAKLYYLRDLRGKAARIKNDRGRVMKDAARAARAKGEASAQTAKAQAATAPAAAPAPQVDVAQTDVAQASSAQASGDNLVRIEGIGPKYAEALRSGGVSSFAQLAEKGAEGLREVVQAAGMSVPASIGTWGKQAQYLVDGDEAGFKTYTESMKGGIEAAETTAPEATKDSAE